MILAKRKVAPVSGGDNLKVATVHVDARCSLSHALRELSTPFSGLFREGVAA